MLEFGIVGVGSQESCAKPWGDKVMITNPLDNGEVSCAKPRSTRRQVGGPESVTNPELDLGTIANPLVIRDEKKMSVGNQESCAKPGESRLMVANPLDTYERRNDRWDLPTEMLGDQRVWPS